MKYYCQCGNEFVVLKNGVGIIERHSDGQLMRVRMADKRGCLDCGNVMYTANDRTMYDDLKSIVASLGSDILEAK